MKYAIYNKYTGEITQTMECLPEVIELQLAPHLRAVRIKEELDNGKFYVTKSGKVQEKTGDYTLECLPLPCIVIIEDVEYVCEEQPEIEFDAPGTYQVKVIPSSAEYLKKEFSVDNQA